MQAGADHADGVKKTDANKSLRKSGRKVKKLFEEARTNQITMNQKLAQAKLATGCEPSNLLRSIAF